MKCRFRVGYIAFRLSSQLSTYMRSSAFSLPRLTQLFHELEQADDIGSTEDRRIVRSFSVLVYMKAILSFPLRISLHLLSNFLRGA